MLENRSGAPAARRKRAVESFGAASEAIGPLAEGMSVFAVTRGQWSMIDALLYVIDGLGGGCHLSVWTWTIADYEVQSLGRLLYREDLAGATLVIDMAADKKRPDLMAQWRKAFGADSVKVCRSHAKLARVWKGDWRFLLRGSMNLNFNPRFEQFDLTEGGADFDLVTGIENDLPVLRGKYTFEDVAQASKLRRSFGDDVMLGFGDLAQFSPDGDAAWLSDLPVEGGLLNE